MPELPEVETVRRALHDRLVGRRITRAVLHRRDMLVVPGDPPGGFARATHSPRPKRAGPARLLADRVLAQTLRLGKQLALVAQDGNVLCVHLGMSGQLLLLTQDQPAPDHVHATWWTEDGARLVFRDPRRFGGLWFYPSTDELRSRRWSRLGVDALGVTPKQLRAALEGSTQMIKAALLDQRRIAGVGNIYADEALHRAGIAPDRRCPDLGKTEIDAIARTVNTVLEQAIAAKGSTLRDHTTPEGDAGGYQLSHRVYGRTGESCLNCGAQLLTQQIAQRRTVSCPRCQR